MSFFDAAAGGSLLPLLGGGGCPGPPSTIVPLSPTLRPVVSRDRRSVAGRLLMTGPGAKLCRRRPARSLFK